MQLEVIGINDSPWGTRPKHEKLISRSRDRSRTGPGTVLGLGPWVCCFRLLVVSQNRSWDRSRPVPGPVTGPDLGPVLWDWSQDRDLPAPVLGPVLGPRSWEWSLPAPSALPPQTAPDAFPDWHPCFRTLDRVPGPSHPATG